MPTSETLPTLLTEADLDRLRAWDWRKELTTSGRSLAWLARQTGRSQSTVYAYAYGARVAPIAWLIWVLSILSTPPDRLPSVEGNSTP
jgi:hypothetical protein